MTETPAPRRRVVFAVPRRGAAIAAIVLGVAGVAGTVASVVWDLGWILWVASLVAIGVAVVLALSGTSTSAVIGLIAGAALVVAGCLAVDTGPPVPADWTKFAAITPSEDDDDYWEVGRSGDTRVFVDRERDALVGYGMDGAERWRNEDVAEVPGWSAVVTGDAVVVFPEGSSTGDALAVSAVTGETQWSSDVGSTEPFSANDDVIVFTDGERTLVLDRATGEQVWGADVEPIASSAGLSSWNPRQWSDEVDWLVVAGDAEGRYDVVDARTGKTATRLDLGPRSHGDWAVVGDTLVTFEYENNDLFAVGTPLAGGTGWKTQIEGSDLIDFYAPVGEELRLFTRSAVLWIDGAEGTLRTVWAPDGWYVDRRQAGLGQARAVVIRDSQTGEVSVMDSVSGEATILDPSRIRGADVIGPAAGGTLVRVSWRDTLGAEYEQDVVVPDGEQPD